MNIAEILGDAAMMVSGEKSRALIKGCCSFGTLLDLFAGKRADNAEGLVLEKDEGDARVQIVGDVPVPETFFESVTRKETEGKNACDENAVCNINAAAVHITGLEHMPETENMTRRNTEGAKVLKQRGIVLHAENKPPGVSVPTERGAKTWDLEHLKPCEFTDRATWASKKTDFEIIREHEFSGGKELTFATNVKKAAMEHDVRPTKAFERKRPNTLRSRLPADATDTRECSEDRGFTRADSLRERDIGRLRCAGENRGETEIDRREGDKRHALRDGFEVNARDNLEGKEVISASNMPEVHTKLEQINHVSDKIVREFKFISMKNSDSVRISLEPENIGFITLKVTSDKNGIHARIITESMQVLNEIKHSGAALFEQLRQLDIKLRDIEVQFNQDFDTAFRESFDENGGRGYQPSESRSEFKGFGVPLESEIETVQELFIGSAYQRKDGFEYLA